MKMNNYNKCNKGHIKKILKEMNLKFITLRTDNDLIYMIEYLPKEFLNNMNSIPILLIYSIKDNVLISICPNIYKIKKGDSTLNILYALNQTNTRLSNGNVTLNEKFITYKYQERFDSINLITKEKLISIFNDIIIASIYTCEEIKRMKENEK